MSQIHACYCEVCYEGYKLQQGRHKLSRCGWAPTQERKPHQLDFSLPHIKVSAVPPKVQAGHSDGKSALYLSNRCCWERHVPSFGLKRDSGFAKDASECLTEIGWGESEK
ncbi:UNVERIFIED_CONTAM: hypothetical protein K2H54_035360 [Gekko kuhli]